MRKLVLVCLACLTLVAMTGTGGYFYFMTFHPDPDKYPVRGIDVSHHQGPIDWQLVAGAGISFAYMKATEGGDFSDRRFAQNWASAKAAGVRRGAYHFFTFCRPGIDQANHFIKTVPNDADTLPPAVDLEFGGNCSKDAGRLDVDKELPVFLKRVESHYGRKALLYATREFYEAHMVGKTIENPLWLRNILFEPSYNTHPWTIWQYHNRGTVAGIDGPVDHNVFVGSEYQFGQAW